jgi:prevent-host-death family protein
MPATIHAARAHLSKLVEVALSGEDVVVTKRGKPVARLVAIREPRFKIGLLEGRLKGPGPDFLSPMEAPDFAAWEGSGTSV